MTDRGVLRSLRGRDDGNALVLVIGSMLVIASMALTTLAFTVQSQGFARYTQDYSAAMAAAQSGIEDVISRLNQDDGYAESVDCLDNPALQGPHLAGHCGWTTSTPVGWSPVVPGTTDPEAPHFHYSIDGTFSQSDGTVIVTSTGRVNGEYRTVQATLGKGGSTDHVYYTDFESADPANKVSYPTGTSVVACGRDGHQTALRWWEGRNTASCREIQFIAADRLNGSVHTNDSALSVGAHFEAGFQSADPSCQTVTSSSSTWNRCLRSGSTANFHSIRPRYHQLLFLDDNSDAFVTYPGCHYYGSTRIILNDDGTMTVWNKRANNRDTEPVEIDGPHGSPDCGNLDELDSAAGWTGPVPDQMVVEVSGAPTSSGSPAAYCDAGQLGGPAGRVLPLGTYVGATHANPGTTAVSYSYDTTMWDNNKRCQEGNLYLEGTLKGRVSFASAQSIVVTGDLVLAGGRNGNDKLGLVATNSVEVIRPQIRSVTWELRRANCGSTTGSNRTWQLCQTDLRMNTDWPTRYVDPEVNRYNPTNGVQIAGSIQTLQHSFFVQHYDKGGNSGTLNVFGSIAQRWRGAVGTGNPISTGYAKLYQYDLRLVHSPPPYFPRWANAKWALRVSGEIVTPTETKQS